MKPQEETSTSTSEDAGLLGDVEVKVEEPIVPDTKEEKPAEEEEEEEYELELAEDSALSEEDLEEIAKIAEEKNLTKDQAEKLLASYESAFKKGRDTIANSFKQSNDTARTELLSDANFSTKEKAQESLGKISKVIEAFGGENKDKLVELLKGPAGNSLALANFFLSISAAGADDAILAGKKGGTVDPKNAKLELQKKLYPSLFAEGGN